jgi:hypothetical protein
MNNPGDDDAPPADQPPLPSNDTLVAWFYLDAAIADRAMAKRKAEVAERISKLGLAACSAERVALKRASEVIARWQTLLTADIDP